MYGCTTPLDLMLAALRLFTFTLTSMRFEELIEVFITSLEDKRLHNMLNTEIRQKRNVFNLKGLQSYRKGCIQLNEFLSGGSMKIITTIC